LKRYPYYCVILLFVLLMSMVAAPLFAKEERLNPKEYGVYVKTPKGLIRLLPNVVFDEGGLYYVESNNPAHFLLKDVEYFVIFGKQNMDVFTFNPLVFFQPSSLGKLRHIFGQNVDTEIKKRGNDLYSIKPKGLLGRGYYALWIEDSAWDFIID
jgi:hypothetical protein